MFVPRFKYVKLIAKIVFHSWDNYFRDQLICFLLVF